MDFSSFVTSLATSFLIFLVLMILFTWLSRMPGNAVVYYPNRILKGLEPWEGGSGTRNPFAWIREAASSTERDVIALSGVDTAVYFVFMSTGLFLSPSLSFFCTSKSVCVCVCVVSLIGCLQKVFLVFLGYIIGGNWDGWELIGTLKLYCKNFDFFFFKFEVLAGLGKGTLFSFMSMVFVY